MEIFSKLCEVTVETNLCQVDLGVVLKKLGKYIVIMNRSTDNSFLRCVLKLVNKAINE